MNRDLFQIGYISPLLQTDGSIDNKINMLPKPYCYQDVSCCTSQFSLCRYPTQSGARLYFPKFSPYSDDGQVCNTGSCAEMLRYV